MNWKAILVGLALALLACQSADTLRPTVLITSPHSGDTLVRGAIAVTVRATDNRGMARVEFRVDSLLRDSSTSAVADTYRFNWNAAGESIGTRHLLKVTALDRAGNSASATASVVIGPGVGPTFHTGMIRASETWDPVGNPHIVNVDVYPVDDAVLFIRPGCIIKLERGAQLYCGYPGTKGGTIVAGGKPDSTIAFTSNAEAPAPGDWGTVGVFEEARDTSRFSYCTFEYGGRDGVGWGEFLAKSPVQVDHCVFRRSADYAVVVLPEFVSGLLATNTLAENVRDGIRALEGTIAGSVTWEDLGIPYILDGLTVDDSSTLTIRPGCVLKFTPDARLGCYDGGALVAIGTPEDTIVFTSASEPSAPGDWYSIGLGSTTMSGSRLSYCTIEYGGAYDGVGLYVGGTGTVVNHCLIRHSAGNGVDCGSHGSLEFFTENTVTACYGYPLSLDPKVVCTLPAGNALTGNAHDAILIDEGWVAQRTLWPNLGLPYVVGGWVGVEGHLTIAPGAVLQMTHHATLEVGGGDSSALVADGTEGQITFTSAEAIPAPGDWNGISVYTGSGPGSLLRNCKIEYAGRGNGGNIELFDSVSTLVNDSIGYSAGYGIYLEAPIYPDTVALRLNNTFYNNALGDIRRP
jgi:hypothetical protein